VIVDGSAIPGYGFSIEVPMPAIDAEAATVAARTFLPILAGIALFALAAVTTGPLAVVAGAIGGMMIGGAALASFFPHDECDPPEPTRSHATGSDTNPPPITAEVQIRFPTSSPDSRLTERATVASFWSSKSDFGLDFLDFETTLRS
jgi:hypothetical protein